jgi:cytosine deaminase
MFDLLVKNAVLPNGRSGVDIGCKGDRIAAVERDISAEARQVIEAEGCLLAPPFVDPHFHMDATLSLGTPRMNMSGTLLEGIELWGELKAVQSIDDIIERALRYCDLAVSMGIGAIRSHVDTCDPNLTGVQALLEVRNRVKGYLDLQLVAFPQDGVLRDPERLNAPFGLWIWGWISWVVSLILNERWPMAQHRCGYCASLPLSAG